MSGKHISSFVVSPLKLLYISSAYYCSLMRLRLLPSIYSLLVVVLFVVSGCSKEPTPEEKQADSTLVLAKAQLDEGRYREGRHLLHIALTLDLRLNRARPLAEEYSLLGRIATLSAEFDSALAYYTKAIGQYRSLTDRTNARTLLLEVASLQRQMGKERVAYTMYAEALRLATIFNDMDGMREIQFAMLPSCRALENTEEQGRAVNSLLEAYVKSGDQRMQARAHFESALSSIHREEYQPAVEPLLRALTLADQAKDSLFIISILSKLATTYDGAGNTQQAFETYTEALTRADRTAGAQGFRLEMLIRVGNIYSRNARFAEAGRFYRAALGSAIALKNKLAEGYLFIQLGHSALGDGQVDEALKSIQNAVDLFTPTGYLSGLAFANLSMGVACQRGGRSNDAVGYFKTAVEQRERCAARAKDVYAECEDISLHQLPYYDFLTELLLQLGRSGEAFWYAERNTEYTLYEKLFALDLRPSHDLVNALFTRLHHARALQIGAEQQLAILLMRGPDNKTLREDVLAQIKKAQDVSQDVAAAIVKANPILESAVRFNGVSIADVQRQLPAGSVLLRTIPTNRSVYSFAITNSKSTVQVAAVDRERLHSYVADYATTMRQLEALSDSPAVQRMPLEQRVQELSTQLYATLIRPVEPVLAGAAKVVVVPDRELSLVPIHALRKGGLGTRYFIEQFPVSYLPSLAMLSSRVSITAVNDVVGMGHPGTTSWDVEYELRDIRAFYKDARLYFGPQALLTTLRREHGDVLHLALDLRYSTHSPENSCVILSDVKVRGIPKETLLGEFLGTTVFPTVIISHLRADSINIDQLLPSLFLVNGSSTVIVNTLPMSRKAKKFFGEIFYTTLLAGKTTESAYRQALLEMIRNKEYAAPYMWAPFLLWGKQVSTR
jgi:CHAT domain-containing protein